MVQAEAILVQPRESWSPNVREARLAQQRHLADHKHMAGPTQDQEKHPADPETDEQ